MTNVYLTPENIRIQVNVPSDVQLKLKKLMKIHQHGIWGCKLLKEYEKTFHEKISYEDYGYGSLHQMCYKLNYIFTIVKYQKGSFKLYSAETIAPPTVSLSNKDLNLPAGVIQHGGTIKRAELPALHSQIEIRVSDYYDVSKFWFYENSIRSSLSSLTTRLNSFYSATGDFYKIPLHQFQKGLYCAATFQNELYRGIIVNELPQLFDVVKVRFIDFGTVDLVSVKEIYFLHESFKEPIAAAMRGRLGLVQPPGLNMPWANAVRSLFGKFVKTNVVTAHFEAVQKEDLIPIYTLKLSVMQEGSTVWIHEELIKNNLAVSMESLQDAKQSTFEFVNNTQKMHLVPSFRDLEHGTTPTLSELHIMQNTLGLSMERILKKYIKVDPQGCSKQRFMRLQ